METIINKYNPDLILFGHTYQTRDWVPRISARLNIPFLSDCISYNYTNSLSVTRQLYQGKINADYPIDNKPYILSFQSGSFNTDTIVSGMTTVNELDMNFNNINNYCICRSRNF